MKTKPMLLFCLIAGLLAGPAGAAPAAEPQKGDAALCTKLLDSIRNADFAAFIADGSPEFQAITKGDFLSMAAQLSPRFKAGITVTYFGELRQQGYRMTLWKIVFSDGGDDALVTLSVKDGKVGGFFIH